MTTLPYILATIWGVFWALLLQYSQPCAFLAAKRTWITVVIGIGVDHALAYMLIEQAADARAMWARTLALIACSSIGIIARSLWNEWTNERETLRVLRNKLPPTQ